MAGTCTEFGDRSPGPDVRAFGASICCLAFPRRGHGRWRPAECRGRRLDQREGTGGSGPAGGERAQNAGGGNAHRSGRLPLSTTHHCRVCKRPPSAIERLRWWADALTTVGPTVRVAAVAGCGRPAEPAQSRRRRAVTEVAEALHEDIKSISNRLIAGQIDFQSSDSRTDPAA